MFLIVIFYFFYYQEIELDSAKTKFKKCMTWKMLHSFSLDEAAMIIELIVNASLIRLKCW